jgi:methenyltetrahydrofolate cyclohydrolase
MPPKRKAHSHMDRDDKMAMRTIGDYLDMVASDAPAPGGGSVAGVVGALAAALGEMVVNLTADGPDDLRAASRKLSALRASSIAFGAADELAYPGYLEAARLPKSTPDEKAHRKAMMQEAMKEAATIPMQLADTALELLDALEAVIRLGNTHVLSDAAVAILLARVCVDASLINFRINLKSIRDPEFVGGMAAHAHKVEQRAGQRVEDLQGILAQRQG